MPACVTVTRDAGDDLETRTSKERLQLADHEAGATCALAGSAPDSLFLVSWASDSRKLGWTPWAEANCDIV